MTRLNFESVDGDFLLSIDKSRLDGILSQLGNRFAKPLDGGASNRILYPENEKGVPILWVCTNWTREFDIDLLRFGEDVKSDIKIAIRAFKEVDDYDGLSELQFVTVSMKVFRKVDPTVEFRDFEYEFPLEIETKLGTQQQHERNMKDPEYAKSFKQEMKHYYDEIPF